jgi:transposase
MSLDITEELILRQSPEAQAIIRLLLAQIAALQAEVAILKSELARLKKTPQNSSLPPSSQHPHAKPAPRKSRSKRKRGGQPGHKKHARALIPVEACQEVVTLRPSTCRRCGQELLGHDPAPLRHQVWELPEIKPWVTEYQRHRLACRGCGESTCAALPAGVPQGQAGPRLIALVALLMGCFRQSKSRVALFLTQVLDQPCSTGWVVKLQHQATAALRPAYEELVDQLPAQEVLGLDETPTKEGLAKAWLWTCVAATFTVFAVRATRAATVLAELLGETYDGVVQCDRAKMYWSVGRLQWCWAHLQRDFQALIDSGEGQKKRLGQDLLRPTRKLFEVWARYRDGTVTRAGFQRLMKPIRREIEALLLRGAFAGIGTAKELSNHPDWLWKFVEVDGVEPTNNASERALRHAVIWRKLSFGTQSDRGSRFVETLLTVVETCRQQSRGVYPFIADAVQAHFAATPAPSLARV